MSERNARLTRPGADRTTDAAEPAPVVWHPWPPPNEDRVWLREPVECADYWYYHEDPVSRGWMPGGGDRPTALSMGMEFKIDPASQWAEYGPPKDAPAEEWLPGPPPTEPDERWEDAGGIRCWRPVWIQQEGRRDRVAHWSFGADEDCQGFIKPELYEADDGSFDGGRPWPPGALWREAR